MNKISERSVSERSVTVDRAIELALSFLQNKGFNVSVEQFGDNYKSVSVEITHISGRSSVGLGKGSNNQSLASAIFEAIEHYYYDYENLNPEVISIEDCSNLLKEMFPYLRDDLESVYDGSMLSCRSFKSVLSNQTLSFPIFFTTPHFQGSQTENAFLKKLGLSRYSTNSGTASGVTIEEAILRGSLELIERDSLGIFFINTVFRKQPLQPKILDLDTIPKDMQTMVQKLMSENDIQYTIYDISSNTMVPSYLAKLSDGSHEYNFYGSGSSLSSSYAIERAVLEALQGYHAQFVQGRKIQSKRKVKDKYFSLFQRCCLDEGIFAPKVELITINYSESVFDGEVTDQIEFIARSLKKLGVSLFWRRILDEDLKVVQVVSPELERFYLICHAIPVMPMKRGYEFLKN